MLILFFFGKYSYLGIFPLEIENGNELKGIAYKVFNLITRKLPIS